MKAIVWDMPSLRRTMRTRTGLTEWLTDMGKVTYEINTLLLKDKTVREVMDIASRVMASKGSINAGIDRELGIAALYMSRELMNYKFTDAGLDLTLTRLFNIRKTVNEEFIQIHRLNYFTHFTIESIYDLLEKRKLLGFNVKKYLGKIERIFSDYQHAHRKLIDKSAFATVQDHAWISYGHIEPIMSSLGTAIGEYLEGNAQSLKDAGQKNDVEILTLTYECILFCSGLRNTYFNFFAGIFEKYGVDYRTDFSYADLSGIYRNFVWMMEQIGCRFTQDKDGDMVLAGIDFENCPAVEESWNKIVDVVTDEELMDKCALEALEMNPETKADYERIYERIKNDRNAEEAENVGGTETAET